MGKGNLGRFLERCHAASLTLDAWLAELTPALRDVVAPREGVLLSVGRLPRGIRAEWACGRGEVILPEFGPALGEMPTEYLETTFRPFLVTLLSRQFGRTAMTGEARFDASLGRLGLVDALGIMARDGPLAMWVTIPLAEGETRSDREPLLYRVRRQLQSGFLARRPATTEDVVADGAGRVVHPGSSPLDREIRELLKQAARVHDAERCGAGPDPDAERVWQELWAGGWSLVETVDTDGKRLLLLRRDPGSPNARTPDPRERRALELLARGASYKAIAFELGTSVSTASALSARALARLGFKSRVDFLRHVQASGRSG